MLILGLALVVGYAAGTKNDQIVGSVAPILGIKVETSTLDLANVQTTYQALKANFDGTVDSTALVSGASRGMVAAAGDQYTIYMDKKEADAFNKDLNGDIGGGIGAEIGSRNQVPTIIRTLSDTPAAKAGLLPGDVILAVNDQNAATWSVSDTVNKIRGDVGTTVKVTVKRGADAKEFTITRAKITSPSVDSKIDGTTGIMTLRRFDETTTDLARQAAQNFKEKGVKSVILDLRGNGGGLLSSAQEVAGLWLRDKVVVSERTKGVTTNELRSGTNTILEGIPTVVLVNSSSASASEIVAGALQDNKAATLLGEKTFGKGSVQKLIDLPNNSVLKVTVAKWYTPNGKNINKEGIKPDQDVALTVDDANAGRDPQLDAAKVKLGQ
ncbi:MAG: putative carboxyl-terminal protease [Candidatus Saccharibacteria bacterium]|nr:putative carboxyl-terminal protease [Candidatus Saccharibacteria bacterium]